MPVPANAKTLWDFLLGHGYGQDAAAGILGNIEQESGGNPEAGGPGNAGIIQWTPGSKASPDQPIRTGDPTTDLAAQETDLLTYNSQQGAGPMSALQSASTPQDAALVYSQQFERPLASAANNPNRESSAAAVLAAAQSGNWPSSTTGSTGNSSGSSADDPAGVQGFISSATSALSDTGSLLHGAAVVLDRAFGLFAPGNGWRAVFFGIAGLAGFGAFKAWTADSGEDDPGHLPLAIGLTGITVAALFFAMRPWPQTSAGPIKPGAYIADTLQGTPPPSGPSTYSESEVELTEAGLGTLLTLWAAGKAAGTLSALGSAAAGVGGAVGGLWGWIRGAGEDLGEATEAAG